MGRNAPFEVVELEHQAEIRKQRISTDAAMRGAIDALNETERAVIGKYGRIKNRRIVIRAWDHAPVYGYLIGDAMGYAYLLWRTRRWFSLGSSYQHMGDALLAARH